MKSIIPLICGVKSGVLIPDVFLTRTAVCDDPAKG